MRIHPPHNPKRFENYTKELAGALRKGAVGVLPTDTLYGLVASARIPDAVEKVYAFRKRNSKKPFIILIHSPEDVCLLGARIGVSERRVLKKVWPGRVSVILPCLGKRFRYLHRGANTLAFRVPSSKFLRNFLLKSGPLVAPSANPEGKKPAYSIREAERYFGNRVDFYCDKGKLSGKPSTLIAISGGAVRVLRK